MQLLQFFDSTPHKNNNSIKSNNKRPLEIFQNPNQLTKFTFTLRLRWPKDDAAFGLQGEIDEKSKNVYYITSHKYYYLYTKPQKTNKQKNNLKQSFIKEKTTEKKHKNNKKIKNASKYKEFVKKKIQCISMLLGWDTFFAAEHILKRNYSRISMIEI